MALPSADLVSAARREPRLFAPRARDETPRPAPGGRERLTGVPVQRFDGYRRLRPVTSGLTKPLVIEDPGISAVLIASVALHALLIAAFVIEGARHAHGSPQGTEAPQVQMMFETPTARSGMEGPQTENPGGATTPVTPPKPSSEEQASQSEEKQQQDSKESRPTPAVPTPENPAAPTAPQSPSAELPLPAPAPVNPATAPSGRTSVAHTHAHRPSTHRAPTHSVNPFANPMDLSFGEAPPMPRARHGRHGGSGAPIDMSLGPLVTNGQINAPYMTRNSIRGVSDDYGNEVDRWIRSHMYYPEDAIRNGEEGPSSVHVVLDRQGRVKSVRLTGQSGSYALDAATTGMFQGAKLPPVPPDMKGDHFDIDLTINYILIRR
ncbi:energy transducer TonB [Acidomonas methanolica]|uniref:energy transducer TonB n=1 Tax=Acidomonas methanolica TaxID=437 RepID=UPI002119C660|nr:TonB family protein [Acidomonas methanolica]MCQ9154302.1 TonB family protein [Acidomonas methanolica]